MHTKGKKTIRVPYEDKRHKVSNNMTDSRVTSSKDFVMHHGGGETLE